MSVSRKETRPAWCAQGFRARNRRRLGATRAPCEENSSTWRHGCPVAEKTPRLGEPRAPLQKNSADLVRSGLPCEEKVPSWWPCSRFAEKSPRLGASPAKSRRFLCNGGSARPTRGNIFARGPRCSQIEAISLQGSSSGPTRCAIFAAGISRSQLGPTHLSLSERWPSRQRFFVSCAMAFRRKVGFPAYRQPPFLSSRAARSTSSRAV